MRASADNGLNAATDFTISMHDRIGCSGDSQPEEVGFGDVFPVN